MDGFAEFIGNLIGFLLVAGFFILCISTGLFFIHMVREFNKPDDADSRVNEIRISVKVVKTDDDAEQQNAPADAVEDNAEDAVSDTGVKP